MKKTEFIKNWIEIIAIVCAGLWSFYLFIYSEYIKAPRFIDATVEMESHLPISDGLIPIQIRVELKNTSPRRIFIESAYFEVHGDKIESSPESKFSPEGYEKMLNDNGYTANGYKPFCIELVGGGGFLSEAWADPKEILTVDRVIYVPKNKFSHLECNIYVLSVVDLDLIDVRKSVNNDYSVEWQVRKAGKSEGIWLSKSDKTGYKLLDNNATLKRANAFLVLTDKTPNEANSADAKSRAAD